MSGYYPAGCTTKVFDEAWEDGYADYATVIYTCDKCGSEYEGELMIDSHHDGEEVEAEQVRRAVTVLLRVKVLLLRQVVAAEAGRGAAETGRGAAEVAVRAAVAVMLQILPLLQPV